MPFTTEVTEAHRGFTEENNSILCVPLRPLW
jgi:hypothetical protein